jgi:uncharacterized Ntn-hydrolase superfamily protein
MACSMRMLLCSTAERWRMLDAPENYRGDEKADAMTWSILARDEQGRFGVAIASRFFAVGALCVHTQRGVGALATQALVNPLYGPAGLALLAAARSSANVVNELIAADDGRSHRQLHVLPASGEAAGHTGWNCIDWCGHEVHEHFSVAPPKACRSPNACWPR